jgi:antitoxin component of RelBE/YafQ-DinJ toxin-antitoxin module
MTREARLGIRVDDQLRERIESFCLQNGLTKSEFITRAIRMTLTVLEPTPTYN